MSSNHRNFVNAAWNGDYEGWKKIALASMDDPTFDVNWKDEGFFSEKYTALHCATHKGCVAIVNLLLYHPTLNVNMTRKGVRTAFLSACYWGATDCARALLRHPKLDVNIQNHDGYSPIWCVAKFDRLEILQWWIASGHSLVLTDEKSGTDMITVAKGPVKELLERYKKNEAQTRADIRTTLEFTAGESANFGVCFCLRSHLSFRSLPVVPSHPEFAIKKKATIKEYLDFLRSQDPQEVLAAEIAVLKDRLGEANFAAMDLAIKAVKVNLVDEPKEKQKREDDDIVLSLRNYFETGFTVVAILLAFIGGILAFPSVIGSVNPATPAIVVLVGAVLQGLVFAFGQVLDRYRESVREKRPFLRSCL